jgi:hypothetical protein
MKHLSFLALLIFIGAAGWQIGGELSHDAIGMALGILFGIMASIPTMLMVLAGQRRDERQGPQYRAHRPQITHNHLHVHQGPAERQGETLPMREWRVIGTDERIE